MLAQAVAERAQFIPEQFLIYADLDMVLKSEPRFGNLYGHFIIGEYTESDKMTPELAYRFKRMSGFGCPVHNTYLMAYDKKLGFFHNLEKMPESEEYRSFFDENIKYKDDDYFFEEGMYDFNYIRNGGKFGFEYSTWDSNRISDIFQHRHMKQSETVKYMQILRRVKT